MAGSGGGGRALAQGEEPFFMGSSANVGGRGRQARSGLVAALSLALLASAQAIVPGAATARTATALPGQVA